MFLIDLDQNNDYCINLLVWMTECWCMGMLPAIIQFTSRALVPKIFAVQHHSTENFLSGNFVRLWQIQHNVSLLKIYFLKLIESSSLAIAAPERRKEGRGVLTLTARCGPRSHTFRVLFKHCFLLKYKTHNFSSIVRGYSLRNRCIIQKNCEGM